MDPANLSLSEKISILDWKEQSIKSFHQVFVIVYCTTFLVSTFSFKFVLEDCRQAQRINLAWIVITALLLIFRDLAVELNEVFWYHCITYSLNFGVINICFFDNFLLLFKFIKMNHMETLKNGKQSGIWLKSIITTAVFALTVVLLTVDFHPVIHRIHDFILDRTSIVYLVLACLQIVAMFVCLFYYNRIQTTLISTFNSQTKCGYLYTKYTYRNIRNVTMQAGVQAIFKVVVIGSLSYWHSDYNTYHSTLLSSITLLLTVGFFLHRGARYHFFKFLLLNHVPMFKPYFETFRTSRKVSDRYFEKKVKDTYENWDKNFAEIHQGEYVPFKVINPNSWWNRTKKNLEVSFSWFGFLTGRQRRRVDVYHQSGMFVVIPRNSGLELNTIR